MLDPFAFACELSDAPELRRRFEANNAVRIARDAEPLPVETTLLRAMEAGLPACSGVAVGFDRLLMLKHGHANIADVIPLPIERV